MTGVVSIRIVCLYHVAGPSPVSFEKKRRPSADLPRLSFAFFIIRPPSILLATTFISYHILPRLSLAALTLPPLQSRRLLPQTAPAPTRMRRSIYLALCLLSASSSEATLLSRTANRIHHAAVKRSARLARDIRSVLSNVLIEQPIIGPDTGNRVYCVANPTVPLQSPTPSGGGNSTGGGNSVIVSSITTGSSSRRPTPTPTSSSGGSPVPTFTSDWKLAEDREGASFFDGWNFWSEAGAFRPSFVGNHSLTPRSSDPTHGTLSYMHQLLYAPDLNVNAHRYR